MFGIGTSELIVIMLVALLFLGPENLPKVARTLAKVFGEVRRASDDLRLNIVSIADDPPKEAPKLITPVQFAQRGQAEKEKEEIETVSQDG